MRNLEFIPRHVWNWHTYMHICPNEKRRVYIYTYIILNTYMHLCKSINICIYVHICAYIYICIYVYMHMYTYMHISAHICIMHIYTQICIYRTYMHISHIDFVFGQILGQYGNEFLLTNKWSEAGGQRDSQSVSLSLGSIWKKISIGK